MKIIALETRVYTENGHNIQQIKIGEVKELTDYAAIELTREGKALKLPDNPNAEHITVFIKTASQTPNEYQKFGKKHAKQMVKDLWAISELGIK